MLVLRSQVVETAQRDEKEKAPDWILLGPKLYQICVVDFISFSLMQFLPVLTHLPSTSNVQSSFACCRRQFAPALIHFWPTSMSWKLSWRVKPRKNCVCFLFNTCSKFADLIFPEVRYQGSRFLRDPRWDPGLVNRRSPSKERDQQFISKNSKWRWQDEY